MILQEEKCQRIMLQNNSSATSARNAGWAVASQPSECTMTLFGI